MAKRVPFTLVVTQAAREDLDALRAFEKRQIVEAVDANLLFEPAVVTRKRKNLGEPTAGFEYDRPLWELRVGEYRVFYSVSEADRTVTIRRVRRKPPEMRTQEVLQ